MNMTQEGSVFRGQENFLSSSCPPEIILVLCAGGFCATSYVSASCSFCQWRPEAGCCFSFLLGLHPRFPANPRFHHIFLSSQPAVYCWGWGHVVVSLGFFSYIYEWQRLEEMDKIKLANTDWYQSNIFKPIASGKDSFDCDIPSEVPGSNQQVHLEYGSLDMDVAAHGVNEQLSWHL